MTCPPCTQNCAQGDLCPLRPPPRPAAVVTDKAEMTSSSSEEMALGQAIMALIVGHRAEDVARALSVCLALTVSLKHHENGDDLSMAELTLTRAGHLQRAVLRKSWGQVEVVGVQ